MVERAKLMAMGVRFADDADKLGIRDLHSYTFNRVESTLAWQRELLES